MSAHTPDSLAIVDMARPELIVELVNNLPTIISALQEKDM